MRITVAGVGYVGLSLAVLLAQHHEVTAITTTLAKAEKLNNFISPIQDDEIERFFNEAREGKRKLNLTTMVDKDAAEATLSKPSKLQILKPPGFRPTLSRTTRAAVRKASCVVSTSRRLIHRVSSSA